MVKQPELPAEQWPEIRKVKGSRNTGWAYFGDLVKTVYQEVGEEKTCQILEKFMAENAKKYIVGGMKLFGIEGNDPLAVATYFKLATGDVIGYKAELIQESPKKVIYRLYPPCIWFPKLDIPISFCMRGFDNFERVATKIINPKIKVTSGKKLTAGDPYCEVIFEEIE